MENNYSKEYIWSVTSKGGATPAGSEFSGICLMNKGWGFYNGWGSVKATYDLYEEFDTNDKRRKLKLPKDRFYLQHILFLQLHY